MYDATCQLIACDGDCPQRIEIDPGVEIPEEMIIPPWRVFEVPGWIGIFHACSDVCEQRVRNRLDRL